MWIPKNASAADDKLSGMVTSGDMTVGETVAPYGIAYSPKSDEKAVILQIGSANYILGVCSFAPFELQPGEVGLYSSGGASIILKNDGKVLINGTEFGGEEE